MNNSNGQYLKLNTGDWIKLICVLLGHTAAVAAAAWTMLNTVNYRITVLETNQVGILRVLEEFENLSRDLSARVNAGILPEARRRLDDLDARNRGVEKALHNLEKDIIALRERLAREGT